MECSKKRLNQLLLSIFVIIIFSYNALKEFFSHYCFKYFSQRFTIFARFIENILFYKNWWNLQLQYNQYINFNNWFHLIYLLLENFRYFDLNNLNLKIILLYIKLVRLQLEQKNTYFVILIIFYLNITISIYRFSHLSQLFNMWLKIVKH
jgi:hypothetical protein